MKQTLVALALFATVGTLMAQVKWTGAVDTDMTNALNWAGGVFPDTSANVWYPNELSPYTVSLGAGVEVTHSRASSVGGASADITFDFAPGAVYTISSLGDDAMVLQTGSRIMFTGGGMLAFTSMAAGSFRFGRDHSNIALTFDNATLKLGDFTIGNLKAGNVLTMTNAAKGFARDVTLGSQDVSASDNTANITGVGTEMSIESLRVGALGHGNRWNVTDGAKMTVIGGGEGAVAVSYYDGVPYDNDVRVAGAGSEIVVMEGPTRTTNLCSYVGKKGGRDSSLIIEDEGKFIVTKGSGATMFIVGGTDASEPALQSTNNALVIRSGGLFSNAVNASFFAGRYGSYNSLKMSDATFVTAGPVYTGRFFKDAGNGIYAYESTVRMGALTHGLDSHSGTILFSNTTVRCTGLIIGDNSSASNNVMTLQGPKTVFRLEKLDGTTLGRSLVGRTTTGSRLVIEDGAQFIIGAGQQMGEQSESFCIGGADSSNTYASNASLMIRSGGVFSNGWTGWVGVQGAYPSDFYIGWGGSDCNVTVDDGIFYTAGGVQIGRGLSFTTNNSFVIANQGRATVGGTLQIGRSGSANTFCTVCVRDGGLLTTGFLDMRTGWTNNLVVDSGCVLVTNILHIGGSGYGNSIDIKGENASLSVSNAAASNTFSSDTEIHFTVPRKGFVQTPFTIAGNATFAGTTRLFVDATDWVTRTGGTVELLRVDGSVVTGSGNLSLSALAATAANLPDSATVTIGKDGKCIVIIAPSKAKTMLLVR